MEKETLTLYKIKKDLNGKIFQRCIAFICEFLTIGLVCWMIHMMTISDSTPLLDIIFAVLMLSVFAFAVIAETIGTVRFIIYAIKKVRIETDVLISKEDKPNRLLLFPPRNALYLTIFFLTRKDKNVYRLYFKANDKFELPYQKSYRWSSQYSMRAREIFITSDVGDTFTIVKIKNEVLMVYNNKYFEPAPNLR